MPLRVAVVVEVDSQSWSRLFRLAAEHDRCDTGGRVSIDPAPPAGKYRPPVPPRQWGWEGGFVGEKGDFWVLESDGRQATVTIERVYKIKVRLSIDAPDAACIWDSGQWGGLMMLD